MKRICWLLMIPLLLALCVTPGSAAAEKAAMTTNFRQEARYYGFAVLDEWPSALSGELWTQGVSQPLSLGPTKLSKSGLPVSYLLLVDCSTSMQSQWWRVSSFATALAEYDGTDAHFSLATFGERFSLIWDQETAEGSLSDAVSQIRYTAQRTDLSQGILDAVEYLAGRSRETGELVNLLIISDGVPEYSEDSPPLDEVARQLEEETSILVHTFNLPTGSADSAANMEGLGRGAHTQGKGSNARAMGQETAEFVNELCAMSFIWKTQGGEVEIRLTADDGSRMILPVSMGDVPVLADSAGAGGNEPPSGSEGMPDPDLSAPPDSSGVPEDPDVSPLPNSPEVSEPPEGSGSSDGPDAPSTSNAPDDSGTDTEPGGNWVVWVIAAAAAVAVCGALLAVFLTLRNRRKFAAAKPSKGGVFMRLEVISGIYAGSDELYLTDELIVGRGSRCHIPWKDKEVSPRNSRIFLRDSMIYIEDLGSQQGTALGGMRLHSPNRLRSGDEVSIGPVRFKLKF